MLAVKPKLLTDSFLKFATQASHVLHIQTEEDYEYALILVEYLIDVAEDTESDPRNDLIAIVANSIKEYESKQDSIVKFDELSVSMDQGVSMLRHLMVQYQLNISDFQNEIGSKPLVSMILNGKRSLTKEHIVKLSKRFNIGPALFF